MIDIHTTMEGPIEGTSHEVPMMTILVDTLVQEAMVINMDRKADMRIQGVVGPLPMIIMEKVLAIPQVLTTKAIQNKAEVQLLVVCIANCTTFFRTCQLARYCVVHISCQPCSLRFVLPQVILTSQFKNGKYYC